MNALPVEPSTVLFFQDISDAATRADFESRFWPQFDALRECWALNERRLELRLPWSQDLQLAAEILFPFQSAPGKWNPTGFEAHAQVIRFLADRAVVIPFNSSGDHWYEELDRPGIYVDDAVWLAWCDLLDQVVRQKQHQTVEVLAASRSHSCLESSTVTARGQTVHAKRIADRDWPEGFLDPAAVRTMASRQEPAGLVPVVYEQSGHQVSRQIKKVLERTVNATSVRRFVTRAGTTWFNPDRAETCKLWTMDRSFDEVHFRLSDRNCACKGIISTVAETRLEMMVAEALLREEFYQLCAEEGFLTAE